MESGARFSKEFGSGSSGQVDFEVVMEALKSVMNRRSTDEWLDELLVLLILSFDSIWELREWLTTSNRELGDWTPIDVIRRDGSGYVLTALKKERDYAHPRPRTPS